MVGPTTRGLLGALGRADADALSSLGVERRLPANSVIFHEGDAGDRFVVLLEGRVKATTYSLDGREVLLNIQGPGEAVGLAGAIDGGGRSASVIAIDAVRFVSISTEQLREFVHADPDRAFIVMEELVAWFRRANRRQVEFGTLGALGRVARQLAFLADDFSEPSAEGLALTIPVSHQDLANWVGASREAVGKAMQQLERLGALTTTGRRKLVVLDVEILRTVGE
mgnify:FL=1